MNWNRVCHTIGMCLQQSGQKRAQYLKKHNVFRHIGNHCMVMFRKIPLYPKLISMGNNVWIASGVSLIPHDAIHYMLNYCMEYETFREYVGCVDIKDNVFIGANSTILPNVTIGSNTIVAAGTLVNKSIKGGVYAGVPAKYICSFEEFVTKRRNMPDIRIEKIHGDLTEATLSDIWEMYNRNQTEEKTNEQ